MSKISLSFVAAHVLVFVVLGGPPRFATAQSTNNPIAASEYRARIKPILVKYCGDCHEPGSMQGLDFLQAETASEIANMREVFANVVAQVADHSMPPKDFDQPTEAEHELLVHWLTESLDLKPSDTDRIAPYVVEIYEDKKGNLWFGTMSKGVARFDGKSLKYFTQKDGLPANTVPSFAEDRDGNLWLGTHNGICRYDGTTWKTFGPAEGLPRPKGPSRYASASVTADNKNNIWVRVGTDAYQYDGNNFNQFKVPVDLDSIKSFAILAGEVSLDLTDRKGNHWFTVDGGGVYKYDGKTFTHYTQKDGLCSNNVTSILEDKNGNLWFSCIQSFQPKMTGDGGLCRFDGKTFTQFPEVKGLSKNDIYTVFETRAGDIWIGATGVGAYRYDGTTFTLFDKTDRKTWTRYFGVQSILEDRRGTLWFGFSGGLFRFDGKMFYNVSKQGPWQDLTSEMAKIVTGAKTSEVPFHKDTMAALTELSNGRHERAGQILQNLKTQQPDEPTIQENKLNEVGYQLVFTKQLDLAIQVFRINCRLYPEASNTFDSLAEAYLRTGNEKLAIENYQKSLALKPENRYAEIEIRQIKARQAYENLLVAGENWIEEAIAVPPRFAPTMALVGMEHLRLPAKFREPDSEWFMSYLFAIDLTEPVSLEESFIGQQLLIYFRGLADGGRSQDGQKIDTNKFSIVSQKRSSDSKQGEFVYTLTWQEPFVDATPLKQNIRVKVIEGMNKHGIVFVCASPKPFDSAVWNELIRIRDRFESSRATGSDNRKKATPNKR